LTADDATPTVPPRPPYGSDQLGLKQRKVAALRALVAARAMTEDEAAAASTAVEVVLEDRRVIRQLQPLPEPPPLK
jgi:hypothetical protein